MTDCLNEEIRDQLPLMAHGTLAAADEAVARAHVATCAACRAELQAIESSRRVIDASTPAVDTRAILAALPAPRLRVLAADPAAAPSARPAAVPRRRSWMPPSYVAAAASILIVASLAAPYLQRSAEGPVGAAGPDTSVAAVPGGSGTTSAPTPVAAVPVSAGLVVDGGLSDLSDDDLNTLLAELDAIEATVAAEPMAIRRPVADGPGDS